MLLKIVVALVVIIILLVGPVLLIPSSTAAKFILGKGLTLYAVFKPLQVKPVGEGVYYVTGGIANSGFIIGDSGVIAIDAQMFEPAANKVLKAIAGVTSLPVNTMILTHSDPDHVNGLPAFPRNMNIIAQEKTRGEMQTALDNPLENSTPTPAELKDYLPTINVKTREHMTVNGVELDLLHTGPAHTDGDLIVYLPQKSIVFAGDILTPGSSLYPGIHLEKHGTSEGWIAAMQLLIALNANVYISGHGETLTCEELKSRLQAAIERRAEIARLVAQNKTLDEVKAILNDPPLTGIDKRFPTFTDTTYQELTQK